MNSCHSKRMGSGIGKSSCIVKKSHEVFNSNIRVVHYKELPTPTTKASCGCVPAD